MNLVNSFRLCLIEVEKSLGLVLFSAATKEAASGLLGEAMLGVLIKGEGASGPLWWRSVYLPDQFVLEVSCGGLVSCRWSKHEFSCQQEVRIFRKTVVGKFLSTTKHSEVIRIELRVVYTR